ncbi:MAG TPA: RcnB family protein [Caulobacteraceae bacterium]|nr:RcnB family protein [Caulobacteraceae bacterium]
MKRLLLAAAAVTLVAGSAAAQSDNNNKNKEHRSTPSSSHSQQAGGSGEHRGDANGQSRSNGGQSQSVLRAGPRNDNGGRGNGAEGSSRQRSGADRRMGGGQDRWAGRGDGGRGGGWQGRRAAGWWRGQRGFEGYYGLRAGYWFAPGWGYYQPDPRWIGYDWEVGAVVPYELRSYYVSDPYAYGLPTAPYGCGWIYLNNELVLIDLRTGRIVQIGDGYGD